MRKWYGRLAGLLVPGLAGCGWSPLPLLFAPIPGGQTPLGLPVDAPITIRYDAFGVPHIRVETDRDIYFALGYVHGRDRLAELAFLHASSSGELASSFGAALVAQDVATRALRLDERVADCLAVMRPETRACLDSYVAGINAWITPFGLPFEFGVAGGFPRPWTIEDVLRVTLWLAHELQDEQADLETTTQVTIGLGRQAAEQLFGRALPEDLSYLLAASNGAPARPRAQARCGGSNNWAVAGERSATGLPLLANDPHVKITFPSMWYLVVLDTPTRTFRGATVPGIPALLVGTNGRVSYGVTLTKFSMTDVYAEVLDESATRYLVDGEWRDLQFDSFDVAVAGELLPRRISQPFTHRGPLSTGPAGLMISTRWYSGDVARDIEASLELLSASTVEEAMQIVRSMELFSFNYVFADVEGNIGWQASGRVPRRCGASNLVPLDGSRSDDDTRGFFTGDDLPNELNPPRGYVASANQRPDLSRRALPSGFFASRYRIERITSLLEGLPPASPADMARMQQDVYSMQFETYRPAILDATGIDPVADGVIAELAAWDGRMSADSRAALLFDTLLTELARLLVVSRLPADVSVDSIRSLEALEPGWATILEDPRSSLWVDAPIGVDAPGPPGRRTAMVVALRRVADNAPPGVWGDLNRHDIRHPFALLVPPLSSCLGLLGAPAAGSATTVSMKNRREGTGVSLRLIADMADADRLRIVLPTGQSGRPASPHSRDQYPLWLSGDYLTLPSPDSADDVVLVLSPTASTQ